MQNNTDETVFACCLFDDGFPSSVPDCKCTSQEENAKLRLVPCLLDLSDDWSHIKGQPQLDDFADKFLCEQPLASWPFTSNISVMCNPINVDGTAMPPLWPETSNAAAFMQEKHCVELGCDPQNLEWAPLSSADGHIRSASPLKHKTPPHVTSKLNPSLTKIEGCLKARSTKSGAHDRADGKSVEFLIESSTTAIDDGYTWLKYGQKNIMNRMHPRGYFRCAHQNCPVKKQTEFSSEMQGFVSITYFNRHNHLCTCLNKPQRAGGLAPLESFQHKPAPRSPSPL